MRTRPADASAVRVRTRPPDACGLRTRPPDACARVRNWLTPSAEEGRQDACCLVVLDMFEPYCIRVGRMCAHASGRRVLRTRAAYARVRRTRAQARPPDMGVNHPLQKRGALVAR